MQEIKRIPDSIRIPIPVGEGREKGRRKRKNQDEFSEILEREKGESGEPEQQWPTENHEPGSEGESIPAADKEPGRGLLIDERA